MSEKEQQSIQADFLGTLRDSRAAVSIFLVNGIRLIGQIVAFDQYVVTLKSHGGTQLVYKHAISTVLPQDVKAGPAPAPRVSTLRSRATSAVE